MQPSNLTQMPTEYEVEEEANSNSYLLKNFKVAKCEYKRFFLFGLMFFIIGFIYSFMRILKDTFVMVRQEPTCILYIKILYILPLSLFVILLLNYMLSFRTVSQIFTIICLVFMIMFFAFGIVILFEDKIMFDPKRLDYQMKSKIISSRGLGFMNYVLQTLNQPLATLIYIAAELWGSLILSYLFLSFLNESCTERQHGRFIPPLFIIINISLLISAITTTFFLKLRKSMTFEQNQILMSGIFFIEAFLVLSLILCKHYLEKYVLSKPVFISDTVRIKKTKPDTGFVEGLETMLQSKFLMAMCLIVFCFNMIINLLESVFKNGIKRAAESLNVEKGHYSAYFSSLDQYITSISVMVLNMTSFAYLVDSSGWLFVSVITPVVALVSSVLILGLGMYNSAADQSSLSLLNKIFGGNTKFYKLENYAGMLCLSAMKIFKFTAFDVSKERISMKIEGRYRPKFKSIYDGIFNKFGKSAGSMYGILIASIFADIDIRGMSGVTLACSLGLMYVWFRLCVYLAGKYNKSVQNNECVDIDIIGEQQNEKKNVN
jgi:ATP:ADP antiporter, AAA family